MIGSLIGLVHPLPLHYYAKNVALAMQRYQFCKEIKSTSEWSTELIFLEFAQINHTHLSIAFINDMDMTLYA